LVLALAASGCNAGSRCQPGITPAGIFDVGADGGTSNGTFLSDLASRALTGQAIEANAGYLVALESSENERISLQHLVECALAADASFTVHLASGDLVLKGSAGYGAEWATGPCREECQQ